MAMNKTNRQQENLKEIFALWKRQSKAGNTYFSGKNSIGENIVGFFNTNKKNPKEPDLKVYYYAGEEIAKEPVLSMWCNVSNNGKKYLTGKIDKHRYIGFINGDDQDGKHPYVRIYLREEQAQEVTGEQMKMEEPKQTQKVLF